MLNVTLGEAVENLAESAESPSIVLDLTDRAFREIKAGFPIQQQGTGR
jgi:hypothetical protein